MANDTNTTETQNCPHCGSPMVFEVRPDHVAYRSEAWWCDTCGLTLLTLCDEAKCAPVEPQPTLQDCTCAYSDARGRQRCPYHDGATAPVEPGGVPQSEPMLRRRDVELALLTLCDEAKCARVLAVLDAAAPAPVTPEGGRESVPDWPLRRAKVRQALKVIAVEWMKLSAKEIGDLVDGCLAALDDDSLAAPATPEGGRECPHPASWRMAILSGPDSWICADCGFSHETLPAAAPATREGRALAEPASGWGDYSGALAEIRDDLAGWPKDKRVQRLVAIADAEMAKPSHLDALLAALAAHPSAAPAPDEQWSCACGWSGTGSEGFGTHACPLGGRGFVSPFGRAPSAAPASVRDESPMGESEFTTMDHHVSLWTDGGTGISWTCVVDGHAVHGSTRDEALFWGGWWKGRRSLAEAVKTLAEIGNGARVVTKYDEKEK